MLSRLLTLDALDGIQTPFFISISPAASLGVRFVGGDLALCLWNHSYFDLVLETENVHTPFWQTHVANAVK